MRSNVQERLQTWAWTTWQKQEHIRTVLTYYWKKAIILAQLCCAGSYPFLFSFFLLLVPVFPIIELLHEMFTSFQRWPPTKSMKTAMTSDRRTALQCRPERPAAMTFPRCFGLGNVEAPPRLASVFEAILYTPRQAEVLYSQQFHISNKSPKRLCFYLSFTFLTIAKPTNAIASRFPGLRFGFDDSAAHTVLSWASTCTPSVFTGATTAFALLHIQRCVHEKNSSEYER